MVQSPLLSGWGWTTVILVVVPLLAGGCDPLKALLAKKGAADQPVVSATSSGSATLIIIGCPRSQDRADMWREFIQMTINAPTTIVTATDGAQARLVLNGCPFAETPSTAPRK
jgi:hypothetical protein